jgi:hypothetical protein
MANNPAGPFHGNIDGKTISQWTQDWYTWAFQSPSTVSPFTSPTGDGSGGFDAGSMFFIGGFDTSNGPLDVHVPFGEPLLVPLINIVDTLDPKATENAFMSGFKEGTTSLFAIVDGTPLDQLQAGLIKTDFFSMGPTRPDSVAADFGVPVGTDLSPSKGTGYWIVVDGLAKGDHTLEFGGHTAFTVPGFAPVDLTVHTKDNIHVT